MAYKIIRPRHGIKSLWNTYKSRIYKLGEMLVESPESGVGSGPVNIKFGDGVTDYEKLPYAVLAPVDEVSEGVKNPVTSDSVAKALKNVNIDVVDNLESTSDKLALSANMGRYIKEMIFGDGEGGEGDMSLNSMVTALYDASQTARTINVEVFGGAASNYSFALEKACTRAVIATNHKQYLTSVKLNDETLTINFSAIGSEKALSYCIFDKEMKAGDIITISISHGYCGCVLVY